MLPQKQVADGLFIFQQKPKIIFCVTKKPEQKSSQFPTVIHHISPLMIMFLGAFVQTPIKTIIATAMTTLQLKAPLPHT